MMTFPLESHHVGCGPNKKNFRHTYSEEGKKQHLRSISEEKTFRHVRYFVTPIYFPVFKFFIS